MTWPSGKLPFECKQIAKNLTFFSKKLPKIDIFLGNVLEKNVKYLSIFWQSNGNFPEGQTQMMTKLSWQYHETFIIVLRENNYWTLPHWQGEQVHTKRLCSFGFVLVMLDTLTVPVNSASWSNSVNNGLGLSSQIC